MKQALIVKLLAINATVILIVILFVWTAVDYLAADYFGVLMEQYHISPTESHKMFVTSVHRYLISATVLAVLAAAAGWYGISALWQAAFG